MLAVFLAVDVPFFCLTLMKPSVLAPLGHLLPASRWRTLQLVTTLSFWGVLTYGLTKGRRKPTAPR